MLILRRAAVAALTLLALDLIVLAQVSSTQARVTIMGSSSHERVAGLYDLYPEGERECSRVRPFTGRIAYVHYPDDGGTRVIGITVENDLQQRAYYIIDEELYSEVRLTPYEYRLLPTLFFKGNKITVSPFACGASGSLLFADAIEEYVQPAVIQIDPELLRQSSSDDVKKRTASSSRAKGCGRMEQPYRQDEVTKRAMITFKPEPGFTEEARMNNVNGVVRLRAILHSSGAVQNISVVKGLPDGLTEKAIVAARQIRFTPAEKDSRAVSQYVVLEYNFNVY